MYYDGYYGYGYDSYYGPVYGGSTSEFEASTGYVHTYGFYTNAYGSNLRTFDEERGPSFDRTYQYTHTYHNGLYTDDQSSTVTPLDGIYSSYGTRYRSTYDITDHVATMDYVTFTTDHSYSYFHSINYYTGSTVSSYDQRFFTSGGFYEYTQSTYSGVDGTTTNETSGYHYNGY